MRSSKACFAIATFVLAASFSSAAFAQTDADKAAARQLATQGAQALSANKYAEALDLVTRAEAMYHAPTHVAMIAKAQVGLGHFVAAREEYIKLSREELGPSAPAAFKAAVEDARVQIPIVEAKIANLRIVVHGGEGKKVTVKLDEQPVPDALIGVFAPVDPGKHDVSISTGGAPAHASVELGAGDKKDITLDAPAGGEAAPGGAPADTGNPGASRSGGFFTPVRIAGLAVGGAGVVGVAVGTIFLAGYLSGTSSANQQFNACNPGCSMQQEDAIKAKDKDNASKGTIATIGLTAGGAALAAGVILVVIGKPSAPQSTGRAADPSSRSATGSIHLSPFFTGSSAGVAGTF